MFGISFVPAYITNRILAYCATHIWKIALLLLLIWFHISLLVPITHSVVRRALTNNTDTLIWASGSVDAYTTRIFYHLPLIFCVSNTIGQSVQAKIEYSTITRHKLWLTHPTWTFWLAIPFKRNFKVDQRNGRINLKVMSAIVSIEILLTFNITNTRFGKTVYYNKESVNNMVQCPVEDSKVVTDCPDGHRIKGSVVIILVNSTEICHIVPLCVWYFNGQSLLLFLTMSFHSQPLSISRFIQTQ